MLTGQTILDRHADVFTFLTGDLHNPASRCEVPESAFPGSLVYASTPAQMTEALLHHPAILIVPSNLSASVGDAEHHDGHGPAAAVFRSEAASLHPMG
jgi:hypothetical protein